MAKKEIKIPKSGKMTVPFLKKVMNPSHYEVLREHKVVKLFVERINDYDCRGLEEDYCLEDNMYIVQCFVWRDTPEGHLYWQKLSEKAWGKVEEI